MRKRSKGDGGTSTTPRLGVRHAMAHPDGYDSFIRKSHWYTSKYGYTKNVIRPVARSRELYTVSCMRPCSHETLTLAARKGCGVVVCNFNLYLLAAGTPRGAVATRQFEALSYSLKRCAGIDLLTSWLEMKLGCKIQTRERCNSCKLNGRRRQHPHRSRLASALAETHYCTDERLVQACQFLVDVPRQNQAYQEANHLVLCASERHALVPSC